MNLEKSLSKSKTVAKDKGTAPQSSARSPRRNNAGKICGEAVTSLGSLEAEIMDLVWESGRPIHGMEVAEASLYKRREQALEPMAFSTVATTLRRLSEKGLLTVGQKPGGTAGLSKRQLRTPYYTPTVGREEMAARIMDHVSRTMLGRPMHRLLPHLAGGPEGDTDRSCFARIMQALEQVTQPKDQAA